LGRTLESPPIFSIQNNRHRRRTEKKMIDEIRKNQISEKKAEAYDILLQITQLQTQLRQLNEIFNEKSKEIISLSKDMINDSEPAGKKLPEKRR
jgi:Zn-dependent M32 family carboxypeptidase